MADKYTGRHIRQARHGAWVDRGSARPRRQARGLLPAAAALIVSGVLFGGAGVLIQISPVTTGTNLAAYRPADDYHPADPYAYDPYQPYDPYPTQSDVTPTGPDETTSALKVVERGVCDASFSDRARRTVYGEWSTPDGYTAAHPYLPVDTLVRVIAGDYSVMVRINDRLSPDSEPYGRCLDLSRAAFEGLHSDSLSTVEVRYEVLG